MFCIRWLRDEKAPKTFVSDLTRKLQVKRLLSRFRSRFGFWPFNFPKILYEYPHTVLFGNYGDLLYVCIPLQMIELCAKNSHIESYLRLPSLKPAGYHTIKNGPCRNYGHPDTKKHNSHNSQRYFSPLHNIA